MSDMNNNMTTENQNIIAEEQETVNTEAVETVKADAFNLEDEALSKLEAVEEV